MKDRKCKRKMKERKSNIGWIIMKHKHEKVHVINKK